MRFFPAYAAPAALMGAAGLLLLSLSFAPAAAQAQVTTIGFDDIPLTSEGGASFTGDRYRSQGVLLSSSNAPTLLALTSLNADTPSTVIVAYHPSGAGAEIDIHFVVPDTSTPAATDFVSFFVADTPPDTTGTYRAQIFDVNNNLLETQTGQASRVSISFSRPAADINRLVFWQSLDRENMDTLRFNAPSAAAAAAPEPATLALVGMGVLPIAGAVLRNRRRK